MGTVIELQDIHVLFGIVLAIVTVIGIVWRSGKSRGSETAAIQQLEERLERELRKAADEHRSIRRDLEDARHRIDKLCGAVSEAAGKLQILVDRLK